MGRSGVRGGGRARGLILALAGWSAACGGDGGDPQPFCPAGEDLAALVDPMIGTDGSGNAFPGALVPHGMVKLSPDTLAEKGSVDAYRHEDTKIEGFTHTQLQGPGGSNNGYSQILLQPTTGPLKTQAAQYASTFSHASEQASPGYYAVTLEDYGIRAELTATAHAGLHRYTFPAASEARVLVDLGHSLGKSRGGQVEIVDDQTIEGHGVYMVHPLLDVALNRKDAPVTGESKVYFHARFSRSLAAFGTFDLEGVAEGSRSASGAYVGAWGGFASSAGEVVEVRVGLSLISVEQARRNLRDEVGDRTFDEVRQAARAAWNCLLNRVEVEGGSAAQRTIFYTALYHTLIAPADYTEAGGVFYSAADGQGAVFEAEGRRFYTDDWCAWDTFRTSRPLATLVEPETVGDVVASYLHLYQQGGWLPKCTWHASGFSRVMIGNHAVSIIADALSKGLAKAEAERAWAAVYKSGTEDTEPVDGACGYLNLGTPREYIDQGYVSHECDLWQSASMTLEYAYDDWCIAQVARLTDRPEQQAVFAARAQNFRHHWDAQSGFMRGRQRDGTWVEPFDPANDDDLNDFCEASAWIYSWFVPHDVPALIALMGGAEAFVAKLDRFFGDGHFDSSNEPSFHVPYLYNYAGAAAKTQATVRRVLAGDFSTGADGLPGNDDSGATSAWYVLSAIGLYPVAPGSARYDLAAPLFSRVTIHLAPTIYPGGTFVIEAPGASTDNGYIQSATLDGQPLSQPWIDHAQVVAGGRLLLELGPAPSSWGAASR